MSKDIRKEHPDFVQEVDTLTGDQLKARIVQLQQALEESNAHKEANDDLTAAKANVTELNGPYQDVRKAVQLKTKYLIELLKEKG
jgi:hypothetical protein